MRSVFCRKGNFHWFRLQPFFAFSLTNDNSNIIPDERPISNHKKFNIKTVRKKSFPIFGKVVDVNWKGKDCGTGLVKTLSTDESITDLAKSIGNLAIRARDQGWTLTVDRKFSPTNRSWESIQKIAEYVLSSPRSL